MRRASGFTLIEMLIVIAITALLVTTAVQAHLGIRRAQERAAQGLSRSRAAEVFLDRFERELAGTILVKRTPEIDRLSHPYVFVGVDNFEAEADADALRFVTRTPARAEPLGRSSGLRMVTYALRTAEAGDLELLREETLLPERLEKEPVVREGRIALDGVATFRLSYMDEETSDWRDAWDSTDVALLDRLPLSVEITVALQEPDEETEWVVGPEHRRVIPIPVRPFDLEEIRAAARGGAVKGEDPNDPDSEDPPDRRCVTIAQCAARFRDISSDPQYLGFASDISKVGRCFNPTSKRDAWFATLLRSSGHSPEECR